MKFLILICVLSIIAICVSNEIGEIEMPPNITESGFMDEAPDREAAGESNIYSPPLNDTITLTYDADYPWELAEKNSKESKESGESKESFDYYPTVTQRTDIDEPEMDMEVEGDPNLEKLNDDLNEYPETETFTIILPSEDYLPTFPQMPTDTLTETPTKEPTYEVTDEDSDKENSVSEPIKEKDITSTADPEDESVMKSTKKPNTKPIRKPGKRRRPNNEEDNN